MSGRPKGEVLANLAAAHPGAAAKIFVEDKLSTLEKVAKWVPGGLLGGGAGRGTERGAGLG